MFSKEEILLILDALANKYGRGYSDVAEVGRLQAKLSVMLELANKRVQADGLTDEQKMVNALNENVSALEKVGAFPRR